MTLYIPDISHHQGDISIQALKSQGAAALIARVGQGAGRRSNGQTYGTTQDRKWTRNHAEARRVGLPSVPYWYIGNLISADENARLAEAWVGDKSLPWMLDHEDASGSISFYHQVRVAFARRGLRVILGYVPHWYWEGAGRRAPLTPGPPLVASRYSAASGSPSTIYAAAGGDRGQGWASYGGQDVALWQFTNKASMAGQAIDCSAFRGTRAQLAALLGGEENDMDLADRLPPIKLADGNLYSLTVGDVLSGMAQYIGGEGTPQGPQTAHPQGQYNSRVLSLAGIDANVQAISGALGEQEARILAAIQADTADQIDVPGLAAALAARVGVDLSVELAAELDRRARDGDPATGPVS